MVRFQMVFKVLYLSGYVMATNIIFDGETFSTAFTAAAFKARLSVSVGIHV